LIAWLFMACVYGAHFFTILSPGKTPKLFYAAVVFALWGIALQWRLLRADKLLPLALVVFAAGRFAWLSWNGQPTDPSGNNIYLSYWHDAKYMLWAAPVVFYANHLARSQVRLAPAWILALLMLGESLGSSLLAFHEYWVMHTGRVVIGLDSSTITAYMLATVHLLALYQCLLVLRSRSIHSIWVLLVLVALIGVQYLSILQTGTRSAMLVYPLVAVCVLVSLFWQSKQRSVLIGAAVAFAMVFALGYSSILKPRFSDFKNDIVMYSAQPVVGTSIGQRFAMWSTGWYCVRHHPLGETIAERYQLVSAAVKQGQINPQALDYIEHHLHDELLETMSLQGFWGGALLLLLYAALARHAWRAESNARTALLIVFAATVLFGVGDVLFMWSKMVLLLLVSMALGNLLSTAPVHEHDAELQGGSVGPTVKQG